MIYIKFFSYLLLLILLLLIYAIIILLYVKFVIAHFTVFVCLLACVRC